jgi:hypothetical protein
VITQLLAGIVGLGLIYGLMRLRHFILACGPDKRRYYRAYLAGFDQEEWEADRDPASAGHAAEEEVEWPSELELPTTAEASSRPPSRSGTTGSGMRY